jgi:hypothetical protein
LIREEGFVGGLEPFCEALEEYYKSKSITRIPPLYRYIFDARGGSLTQSKAIHYLRDAWIKVVQADGHPPATNPKFDDFLKNYISNTYQRVM